MNYEQVGEMHGDACYSYKVTNYKSTTVDEFIKEVLECGDHWGRIHVITKGTSWWNCPECEYDRSKLISDIDENCKNLTISEIDGYGGWGSMDYYVKVN